MSLTKTERGFLMQEIVNTIVANLPLILCMLSGVALLVVEIFVPGFGLPGISGLLLLSAGIAITWVNYGAAAGLCVTLAALALAAISISISIRSAAKGKIARSALFLKGEVPPKDTEEQEAFLGREGVALTALNPVGIGDFDGVRLNVLSEGNYVEKGKKIKVIQVDGTHIMVREIEI